MSAGTGSEGPTSTDHPALLPWLAAGRLEGEEAAIVRAHLEGCAECRREFDALLSMRETMQRHDRTDHVPTIDLVAYHEGDDPAGHPRTEAIAAHLRECTACAEDIEALRRSEREIEVGRAGVAAPGRSERRGRTAWIASALAAAALLAVLARPLLRPGGPAEVVAAAPATLQTLQSVTFARPTRGDEAPLALAGSSPWSVRVLLPYGSPAGEYAAVISNGAGPIPGLYGRVTASEDGVVTMLLPGLPAPGRYALSLIPVGGGAAGIEYPFEYRAAGP
jgi:hypothetical protein